MGDEIIIETSTPEIIEVGLVGPQGPKGDKGDPGDVSSSVAWDNVTDKPSTFAPSAHTHTAADLTIAQNDIPETFVEDEITSTNSASPTVISLASYYSVANKGLRVRVMLEATVSGSYGAVRLPELSSNETGFVTVRLSTGGNVGQIKVTLNDQAQTPIYPASGYDEIATDTDYTFRWIGDRWEMDILPNESATTAHALGKPNHSGFLAAFRSYGSPPATPTSTGSRGQLAFGYDDGAERLYICVADNVWRRVPIATWS